VGAVLGTSVCRLHFGCEEVFEPFHAAFDRLAGIVRRAAVLVIDGLPFSAETGADCRIEPASVQ